MGSHTVTCNPTQVNASRLKRLTPARQAGALDLPTAEGWKAELAWVAGYIPRWWACPQTVTHPNSNRDRRRSTSLIDAKALPLSQTAKLFVAAVNLRLSVETSVVCAQRTERVHLRRDCTRLHGQSWRSLPSQDRRQVVCGDGLRYRLSERIAVDRGRQ